MKKIVLAVICLILISSPAAAKYIYVTDTVKAMFRTGPGNDHKIMTTVSSGERLTVIEVIDKWTHVKRSNNEEGWVLNQWLIEEVPNGIRLGRLKKKYEKLIIKYSKLKVTNEENEEENKNLKSSLAISKKMERDSSNAYENLKKGSANYLQLEAESQAIKEQLDNVTNEADRLNDELTQKYIFWFLIGAGVLLLGIMIGFSFNKRKRHSLLD